MTDIEPAVDDHGVPFCSESCPSQRSGNYCSITNRWEYLCYPEVQRMAARLKASLPLMPPADEEASARLEVLVGEMFPVRVADYLDEE